MFFFLLFLFPFKCELGVCARVSETGSEIDDEEMIVSESENSNDSWTTEEFSSEFIMRYGSRLIINYVKNAIAHCYFSLFFVNFGLHVAICTD